MITLSDSSFQLPSEEELLLINHFLQLPEDALGALRDSISLIHHDTDLLEKARAYYLALFQLDIDEDFPAIPTPDIQDAMGNLAGMFLPVVLIAGFRLLEENYLRRGITTSVLQDTLADMPLWMGDHYNKFGTWGLEVSWLSHHFTFRLFRLERLQFALSTFHGHMAVYRNRASKALLTLAEGGIRFTREGQYDGTNHVYDPEGAWESTLEADYEWIHGHRILPNGTTEQARSSYDAASWELVLRQGDRVLDIHIPEGGRLDQQACLSAIRSASAFFPQHFPEHQIKAYICTSWLLDAQFVNILPATSNIVQFQTLFTLYPVLYQGTGAWGRIFGHGVNDMTLAPRDTSLRRAVAQFVEEGNHLRDMGGYILPDQFE